MLQKSLTTTCQEVEGQIDIFDFLDTEQKNQTGSEEHLKYESEENHEQ